MIDIELAVTNKCNWNCSYCLVDVHNQPEIKFKDLLKTINDIPENSEVTLSGGEPGMLQRYQIETIIKILKDKNCVIDLLTNGLFLEKYSDLLPNISEILYHCVEDLDDEFKRYNIENLHYVVVTLNEDIMNGRLEKFLKKNNDINFLLSPNKLLKSDNKIYINFLSLLNRVKNIHPRTKEEFIRNMVKR